jgi:hypothetical protein
MSKLDCLKLKSIYTAKEILRRVKKVYTISLSNIELTSILHKESKIKLNN